MLLFTNIMIYIKINLGDFMNTFDIKNDNLSIKFNRFEQKYEAYLPNGEVVYNLNRRSEKMLGKKNKELLLNPELLDEEMIESLSLERYHKLKDLGYSCNSFEVLFSERGDDCMSEAMANYLNELTSEEDVLIGIHRTGSCGLDEIADILRYGLTMTTLNGSTTNSPIHLMNNVSYYPDNSTIIKELINADSYKDSLGSILIRIPDEDLSGNIFMIDSETCQFILDPTYIIGFVPVGPNGKISEIITPYPPQSFEPFKDISALYEERSYAKDNAVGSLNTK